MAGAKSGVHMLKLRPVIVPEELIKGNKFIKWDDDTGTGTPVTLRVDPKGFILYWKDQNKDMDCLDISLIRDTRTGKYGKVPKDLRLRDTVTMGTPDVPLEDKVINVCHGTDMVNVSWLNFAAISKDVAELWTSELFKYATNLLAQNACPLSFLEKCYSKLSLVTNIEGKISVKNIVKMFSQHKDDRKRVEKALEASGLPAGKNDQINPSKFTFEDFLSFYRHLCSRQDVEKIFHSLGAKKKPYLTAEQFVDFLNKKQRDPRLNEILYPYCDVKKAQQLINMFEPNRHLAGKDSDVPPGHLSHDGFLRYLLSDDNALVPRDKLDINEDMDQPLSHYFINSSHNTYLTGHQLTGKSSVEIYRQALLTGCRCIELDCWDGKGADEEPIITHGFTMCTEIIFKEVVEAIAETAFKVSDFPVILSFENHCSPKQQAKMAAHCRNILGDALLVNPLDSNPLEPEVPLPSPELLKGKIIIKNKKRHMHKSKVRTVRHPSNPASTEPKISEESEELGGSTEVSSVPKVTVPQTAEPEEVLPPAEHETVAEISSESESESEEEEEAEGLEGTDPKSVDKTEKGTAGQEAEAGMEMSALVNYIQPARFHSFEHSDNRNRGYECVSFVETQATALLKEFPVDFVNFNKRQLSRIYPKGTRVDSSNYMPQIFWNAGCQLVALNFQTLDLAMQLNLGIFEYNGRTGYILKPDFMRRKDRQFDPFAESTVDGIIAGTVQVKVISGQFLTDKKVGTCVEVDMYGLPADTVRKKFRTKIVPGNGICPQYEDDPFVFRKVVLPNLATLRIAVYDESNKLLGHRVLPVEGLRPGFRHVGLRNELNQPLSISTIFVHITVGDYVSDAFADFAEALSNPIAYQSQLEKHAQQLSVLEEDFEVEDEAVAEIEKDTKPKVTDALPAFNRVKNLSVGSRHSHLTDPPASNQLSRGGSERARNFTKQESYVSQTSQGSTGNPPHPMTHMVSTATLNLENGSSSSHVHSTKLNGSKPSTSVPSSPMHAISNPMASSSTGPENGAVKPQSIKIDIMQTTQLKEPDLLQSVTLEYLKEQKQYTKLAGKRDKELDTLYKKHDKARAALQEIHEHQEEKLLLTQMKSKSSVEKTQRKSMRKASRHGNPSDDLSSQNQQEMARLLTEQETKHRTLREAQVEGMIALCREHYQTELELQLRYHPLLYDTLEQQVNASQVSQSRRLDEIHDREVIDLKKKLEIQTREEMKSLAKKHKDKNELARVKREANQKLINLAVQERQKLRDILEKRKTEASETHSILLKQLSEERKQVELTLKEECENRKTKMASESKSRIHLPAKSGTNGAPGATNGGTSSQYDSEPPSGGSDCLSPESMDTKL